MTHEEDEPPLHTSAKRRVGLRLALLPWTLFWFFVLSWTAGTLLPGECSAWCFDMSFVVAVTGMGLQVCLTFLGLAGGGGRVRHALPVAYLGVAALPFVVAGVTYALALAFDPGFPPGQATVVEVETDAAEWDAALIGAATAGDVLVIGDSVGRLWSTLDGTSWNAIPQEGLGRYAKLESLTAWAGGIAAGGVDHTAGVWTRQTDGSWVRAELGEGRILALAAFGNGLAAFGEQTLGSPMVWLSEDGVSWSKPVGIGSGNEVSSLASFDGGLVAVGWANVGPNVGDLAGAVWTSTDGKAWGQFTAIPAAALLNAVTAFQNQLVAVGVSNSQGTSPTGQGIIVVSDDGHRWTTSFQGSGPLFDVVVFEDQVIAVGTNSILASTDGKEWREVTGWVTPGSPTRFLAATVWGDQLVVSGFAEHPCNCVLLMSPDTETWRTVAPQG